jgi:lysophospholipase L1-like esterase
MARGWVLSLWSLVACSTGNAPLALSSSDPDLASSPPDLASPLELPVADDAAVAVDLGSPPDFSSLLRSGCFAGLGDPARGLPDYEQFAPVVAAHCDGTDQQNIRDVEKLVFLGDSITVGTPPSLPTQFYRALVAQKLFSRNPLLEVKSCAEWGARTEDLLEGQKQIERCFSPPERKRTLVVMTAGGNDFHSMAKHALSSSETLTQSLARADAALAKLRAAVAWLKSPVNFPRGSFVVMANVYEFTDGMGDPQVCPAATLDGLDKPWPDGRAVFVHLNEQILKIAVDSASDMIFMAEAFCGHGFNAGNPANECWRGAGAATWFDASCIHPTPDGHARIAAMFLNAID